jgi:hypothetical protein
MLPGLADMTISFVDLNTASLIEWVMNGPAKPPRRRSRCVSSLRFSRVISSTAPYGSSKRKTGGLRVSVWASDARIFMPPDNDFGCRNR